MGVTVTSQVTSQGDSVAIAGSGAKASIIVGEASVEVDVRDLCDTLREYCKVQGIRFAGQRSKPAKAVAKATEKKQAA